jgi:hypothetical protein
MYTVQDYLNDVHPLDAMARDCEVQAGDPSECPPEDWNWWLSQDFEDRHYSKRLIKVMDAMLDEDLDDESLWANNRHSEMMCQLHPGEFSLIHRYN